MVGVLTVTDAEDTSTVLVVLLSKTLEVEEAEEEFFNKWKRWRHYLFKIKFHTKLGCAVPARRNFITENYGVPHLYEEDWKRMGNNYRRCHKKLKTFQLIKPFVYTLRHLRVYSLTLAM